MGKVTAYHFNRRLADGTIFRLGTAVERPEGWRFIPNIAHRHSSRKSHATMEKCLPRWIGYPDSCQSEPVNGERK